jgi:type VI secretion system protein VasD
MLTTTKSLNQDDAGASLPVVVRVYQLKTPGRFQHAEFKTLWKNDKDVLESDLLERKELTVFPDAKAVVEIDVQKKNGAEYVGVMALFRKPDMESWKQIIRAESSSWNPFTPKIKLVLDQYRVKLDD